MTQLMPRVPTQAPLSICQLLQSRGGGHLSSRDFRGMLHRDQFMVYSNGQNAGEEEKKELI